MSRSQRRKLRSGEFRYTYTTKKGKERTRIRNPSVLESAKRWKSTRYFDPKTNTWKKVVVVVSGRYAGSPNNKKVLVQVLLPDADPRWDDERLIEEAKKVCAKNSVPTRFLNKKIKKGPRKGKLWDICTTERIFKKDTVRMKKEKPTRRKGEKKKDYEKRVAEMQRWYTYTSPEEEY